MVRVSRKKSLCASRCVRDMEGSINHQADNHSLGSVNSVQLSYEVNSSSLTRIAIDPDKNNNKPKNPELCTAIA